MLSTKKLIAVIFIVFSLFTSEVLLANTQTLETFGGNPGELSASYLLPDNNTNKLVVLLHGCGQQAEWLAKHSGLLKAANSKKFVLLLPQQLKSNNMQFCFNWFSPKDHLYAQGETQSLMNMISRLKQKYSLTETYLIGLSAGGSMVTSIIAQYPDQFTAAASIAGVAYPCADNLVKALSCMKNGFAYSMEKMVQKIPDNTAGKWPNLTIIAGTKDAIVSPQNSHQMSIQWQTLMATDKTISDIPVPKGVAATRYLNATTNTYVELVEVQDIGHGWPINSQSPYGDQAAPFVIESSLSSTDYLVTQWGL